jgi:FHA domain/Domain of unknown function (DUF1707)
LCDRGGPPILLHMEASTDRTGQPPAALRLSDADRDQAIGQLRDRFADGCLSQDSFVYRVGAVLRARRRGELADILGDLPPPRARARTAGGRLAGTRQSAARELAAARQSMARDIAAARRHAARLAARLRQPRVLVLPAGSAQRFTIGRDADCDLVLPDLTVSRVHAGLRRDAGGWLLDDIGSTNGTRVNGWRVTGPVPVRPGDRISFGALNLVVSDRR